MGFTLQGVQNARELGGWRTADGRTVKSGLLLRTGELQHATAADIRLLQRLGVRHVVDFRDPAEAAERPDAPVPGAAYHNLPALPAPTPPDLKGRNSAQPPDPEQIFPQIYAMLGSCPEARSAYRAFFDLLLEGNAVLWHCRQGKDRTGLAALLLLTALGVSSEDALADYLATNESMQPVFAAETAKNPDPERTRIWRALLFVRPEWLRLCLDEMDRAFGGPEGYLRDGLGLTQNDLTLLRTLYTK